MPGELIDEGPVGERKRFRQDVPAFHMLRFLPGFQCQQWAERLQFQVVRAREHFDIAAAIRVGTSPEQLGPAHHQRRAGPA